MSENAFQALESGFAVRARLRDEAELAASPGELMVFVRQIVDNDPHGAACALFATVVEHAQHDSHLADLARLYERWQQRARDEVDRLAEGDAG